MEYNILYHHLIKGEDLPRIPVNIRQRIKLAIEERMLKEPFLSGAPLRHSLKGHRKMRVGDYRIIYRIEQNNIIVLKIGHRKDIYWKVLSRI
jgi:mRNA interferase RelE/StbE